MFVAITICLLLAAQAFTAKTDCDMTNRFPGTCPPDHCCAAADFPIVAIECKPLPKAGQKCAVRNTPFHCPCAPGLTCKANTKPNGSKLMFGKCA